MQKQNKLKKHKQVHTIRAREINKIAGNKTTKIGH
jgi:hypothetical protein